MPLRFPTARPRRQLPLAALIASLLLVSGVSDADGSYMLHSQYQAVSEPYGAPAWSGVGPITMTGVVLHDAWDMLYYADAGQIWPADVDPRSQYSEASPQWQVYFQATEAAKAAGDFGGTAMYMRKYAPAFLGGHDVFPDPTWTEEMNRLNYPIYVGSDAAVSVDGEGRVTEPLRRGDLIEVVANAPGLHFGGKYNINTQHLGPASAGVDYDEDKAFSITILERGVPLASPVITLADLKDANDQFIFDATRQTGCEHYQAGLVHLDDLLLVDPENWGLYNTVTVRQGDLTFPMQLGIDPALASVQADMLAATPFSVAAILNQEAPGSGPWTGGYRLWLTSAADLTAIPEPGAALILAIGFVVGVLPLRPGRSRRPAR